MITIVNLRQTRACIRVDRATVLGNPFVMHTEAERDSVCDQYEVWLSTQVRTGNRPVCDALNRIYSAVRHNLDQDGPIALGCWCAPKRCHAQSIVKLIEEKLG